MRKILTLLIFCFATTVFADQFQMNEKPVSLKAANVVKSQKEIGSFCAPCGDKAVSIIPVQKVTLKRTESGGIEYFTVKVNETEVDLAYIYLKDKSGWKNLAHSIGLAPSGVPLIIKDPPSSKTPQKNSSIDGIEIEE